MDKLITTSELAEYLGVPVATLRYWRNRGDGPRGFRVGRHVRYQRTDVAAWLESNGDPLRDRVSV